MTFAKPIHESSDKKCDSAEEVIHDGQFCDLTNTILGKVGIWQTSEHFKWIDLLCGGFVTKNQFKIEDQLYCQQAYFFPTLNKWNRS